MAHFIPFKGYHPPAENAAAIAIDSYDNYSENDILHTAMLRVINMLQAVQPSKFGLKEATLVIGYLG